MDHDAQPTKVFRFGSLELDARMLELRRDGRALRVQPRVFDLIRYLVENRERVVLRDELLEQVWGGLKVEESSLYRAIALARRLLGGRGDDTAIALVRGRGYRFVAEVAETRREAASGPLFVGRAHVLAQLDFALAKVSAGGPRVVFISGEAGIGKSAIVDRWVDQLRRTGSARVALGQCLATRGASEPYRPLLDALGGLAEQMPEEELSAVLRRFAPTWLAQLPRLTQPREGDALRRKATRADRARMVRELGDALGALSESRPLVLVLEDLQWSDPSTLDVVEACALTRGSSALQVVATKRTVDEARGEPAAELISALRAKARCLDLAVRGLSRAEVCDFLGRRFDDDVPDELAQWCWQRSAGNPLFLTQLIDTLIDRGRIVTGDGALRFESPAASLDSEIPEGIAELVHRQLDALSPSARALLESTAVIGMRACSALIAAGDDRDHADPGVIEQTEGELDALVGDAGLLRHDGVEDWPDGTLSATYAFRHALHRDIVYGDVRPSTCVYLHRRIGAALEKAFAGELESVSPELAHHFDEGRERARALPHFARAIRVAERRYARDEALAWAERAIELAADLSTSRREPAELEIRLALAPALSRAPAHPETDTNWIRAEELCRRVGDNRSLCAILWGRNYFAYQRQEHERSLALAHELLAAATPLDDPFFRVLAHDGLARSLYALCDFERSLEHAQHALGASDAALRDALIEHVGQDVVASSGITAAFSLWHLGRLGEALARMAQTIEQSEALGHSYTHGFVLGYASLFYYGTRDRELARTTAERAIAVATAGTHEPERIFGEIVRAGSLEREAGRLEQVRAALTAAASLAASSGDAGGSSAVGLTILFSEILTEAGELDEAAAVVAAGLAGVASTGERTFEPSLRFVDAQLECDPDERARKLEAAQKLAAEIGLGVLELEIAHHAAAELSERGRKASARERLAPVVARFAGEPPVPVLRASRALLAELS